MLLLPGDLRIAVDLRPVIAIVDPHEHAAGPDPLIVSDRHVDNGAVTWALTIRCGRR